MSLKRQRLEHRILTSFLEHRQSHIHRACVDIVQLKWSRINVKGKAHKHSFVRDGDEKRTVSVVVDATKGKKAITATCQGGISGLLCLKVRIEAA